MGNAELSLTGEQRLVLQAIYDWFHEHGDWPQLIAIDRPLRRTQGLEAHTVYLSLPDELVVKPHSGAWIAPNEELRLRLLGIHACDGGSEDTERFLRLLPWLAQREIEFESQPGGPTGPQVTSNEVSDYLGLDGADSMALRRLYVMLFLDHWGIAGGGSSPDGWQVSVGREIWRFRDVETVGDCVNVRAQWIAEAEELAFQRRNPPQTEYYHVRLSTRSNPSWDVVQLDLTGEQLESRFLKPYREGGTIVARGKTIPIADVAQLRVNRTDQSSEHFRPVVQAERRASLVVTSIPDDWYIAEKGEEVTDELIVEPPGSVGVSSSSCITLPGSDNTQNQMSGTTQGNLIQARDVHGGVNYNYSVLPLELSTTPHVDPALVQARLFVIEHYPYEYGEGAELGGTFSVHVGMVCTNHGDRPLLDVHFEVWMGSASLQGRPSASDHRKIALAGKKLSFDAKPYVARGEDKLTAWRLRWRDAEGHSWYLDRGTNADPLPFTGQAPKAAR